ncbi:MAG: class II aldolase/adducin family protein [Candidatus Binatia bacterium]
MKAEDQRALKEEVALGNRALHYYGLASYMGQASARIPGTDRILIRPRSHMGLNQTTAEMLITMDLKGNIVEAARGEQAPAEWPLHTEIYKARPDVAGVVHTQQKWVTVFGIAGQTILPVHHPSLSSTVVPAYAVYAEGYRTFSTVEEGQAVARTLGDGVGCHLQNHGVVIVGITVQEAVLTAIRAEHQAELNWLAMQAGEREQLPMSILRPIVEKRFVPKEAEKRGGITRDNWSNQMKWADQDPDVLRIRCVQL